MEPGPRDQGLHNMSSVAGSHDGMVNTLEGGKSKEQSRGTRPICLPPPSPSAPPSKRIEINRSSLGAMKRAVQAWMEAITEKPFQQYRTRGFAKNLKTGGRLCDLVNGIRPGTIPKVHDNHKGFEQIENIEHFLAACGTLGVPDHALVDTVDIYEMKDTEAVVACVVRYLLREGSWWPWVLTVANVSLRVDGTDCPHFAIFADGSLLATLPSPETGEMTYANKVEVEIRSPRACLPPVASKETMSYDSNVEEAQTADDMRTKCASDEEELLLLGDVEDQNERPASAPDMQNVTWPSSFQRGLNITVGMVSDLRPPATLSARARKMCPEEVVKSPRALAYDTDPLGHPTRSPTFRTPEASNSIGSGVFFHSAWDTEIYSIRNAKTRFSRPLSPGSRIKTLSPQGLWAAGNAKYTAKSAYLTDAYAHGHSPAEDGEGMTTDVAAARAGYILPEAHGEHRS